MKNKLPKTVKRRNKRVGRGYGSGKGGHTTGRGVKGQRARTKNNILFEGVKMKKSYFKRLPLMRGKGKFRSKPKPIIVNLDYLNLLRSNTKVDINTLIQEGIVKRDDAERFGVKILGGGEIKKKIIVMLPVSKSAAKQIEKAGGKIVEVSESINKKTEKEDKTTRKGSNSKAKTKKSK
ncbi:50S ribosomal protein L15 [Candidatus Woesebacteria bacterium]|nr:50S ribosomal protein L15 [Candidatus Woesebacteria bacterium]